MGQSVVAWRDRIEKTQQSLALARRAGHPYEAYLHRRRLENLIETATRHGVDVDTWLDRTILSVHEEI